jgi:calcineurin-like phosphoesterase family protein
MSTFFTADTHFNHANIIKYCNRPFKDVTEMNEVMIKNWNAVVKSNDSVYHIGDFAFGDCKSILDRLNGKITMIVGSHDRDVWACKWRFQDIGKLIEIRIDSQLIVLCHYAMRVWSASHYNTWHLFGHSHGQLEPFGKSFDVGVDTNDFKPYSFEEVCKKMATLSDNFNLVKGARCITK